MHGCNFDLACNTQVSGHLSCFFTVSHSLWALTWAKTTHSDALVGESSNSKDEKSNLREEQCTLSDRTLFTRFLSLASAGPLCPNFMNSKNSMLVCWLKVAERGLPMEKEHVKL